MRNYYRFHNDNRPSKDGFDKTWVSLIQNSLTEFELEYLFNELDSNQDKCRFEPYELFGASNSFPLVEGVVLPDIYFPCSNENFHNVQPSANPPLLSYGANDSTGELVLPNILVFVSFHPCLE